MTGVVGAVVEARAELRIHRTRVLLSLIGVAVAVTALTTVVGLGTIAQQATIESIERSGGRPATLGANIYSRSGVPLDRDDIAAAVATAVDKYGIGYHTTNGYGTQRIQFVDGVADVPLQIVDVDYQVMRRLPMIQGRWFSETDANRLAPGIIVNEAFWQRIGSPDLRTHPTVTLKGSDDAIAVVLGVTSSFPGDTQSSAMMLTESWERITDPATLESTMPTYEFWVPEGIAQELQDALIRDLTATAGEGAGVDVYRQDFGANGEDPFLPIRLIVTGVAVLILFLGALGLVNISLVTVRQRIREIGIRRSFGATAGRVFFAVMMESVVGTVAAGVVGVALAVVIVQNPWVQEMLAPGVADLPPFPIDAALIGLGSATLVGALAGLLPAIVAVRVRVIDAIRY